MDLEELRLQRFAEEVMAEEYNIAVSKDAKIAKLQKAAVDGVAKYRAAEEIASRTGMHTAEVLLSNLTELYPDGKIPEVDAKALITPMLRHNYDYVSGYTKEAQETMNNDIGVNLSAVVPEFDKGRADGIATSISNADDFTQREDSFRLNVENHSRNIVDEAQKQNMRMHDRVGLEAEVVREYDGVGLHDGKDTCEWCESRAGVWGYRDAMANGVFERHPGCGCEITYTSRKGVTTVQSKAGGYWEKKEDKKSIMRNERALVKQDAERKRERLINFGERKNFDRDYETINAHRLDHFTLNNLYMADNVSLKHREVRQINAQITQAKEVLGTTNKCKSPMVIIDTETILASYNPRTDTFYISSKMADVNEIENLQSGFACSDDPRSTMLHELLHWKDAQEYREKGLEISAADEKSYYSIYQRDKALNALIEAGIDIADIDSVRNEISAYAADKLIDNNFEEVYTEYRTKHLLQKGLL